MLRPRTSIFSSPSFVPSLSPGRRRTKTSPIDLPRRRGKNSIIRTLAPCRLDDGCEQECGRTFWPGQSAARPLASEGAFSTRDCPEIGGMGAGSDTTVFVFLTGGSCMGWILRLVEAGPDITADGVDLIEIDRPTGLAEIANLGLTLSEAKQVLARMQRALVAAQAHDHAVQRLGCSSCNGICHIKDWRQHQIATLFGGVTVRLPRWLCTGCRRIETGMRWPSHCRSSPELDQLQAHLSALMSYRVAAGVLGHLLPVEASTSPETF